MIEVEKKEYKAPKMREVEIESSQIIANSPDPAYTEEGGEI